MGFAGQNELHGRAVKWYHGFMASGGPGVPAAAVRHVRRCLVSRKQIDRLKEAVTGAGGETDTSRSKMKRDIIDTLSEHFRSLDERVTCSRVKPFLPGLLMPSVQVRIPTPITVHVDHCDECAEDLAALRGLALSPEQLERLEQLYQHPSADSRRLCRRARSKIAAFARGSLDGISGEILDHLCTCGRCRSRVHRSRQRLLENGACGEVRAGGEDIPAAALFDYAVPYGRTDHVAQPPSAGEPEGPPPGTGAPHGHVRTGQPSLKRIQELDETIYGIAERTDSGVATVYRTSDEAKGLPGSLADLYPEYPIDVQVIHGEPEPAAAPAWSPARVKVALKRSTCNPRVRLILKTAIAAAAMIPLALLFQNTYTASGITLGQVFRALGAADNVQVTRFYPETGEVLQELRISREMKVTVVTNAAGRDIYNLRTKQKKSVTSSGAVETVELSEDDCARVRGWMDGILGFASVDVPIGAPWRQMSRDAAKGRAVYELTCDEQILGGGDSVYRWEVTLDAATKLPQEIREFQDTRTQEPERLLSVREFRYLSRTRMAAEIRESLDSKQ
jgi:hypothetical protein